MWGHTGTARRAIRACPALALAILTTCSPPPEAEFETSAREESLPPALLPTSSFDAALAAAAPDADRLADESEGLRARAAALRARATELSDIPPGG
jgi:hypothetical protein